MLLLQRQWVPARPPHPAQVLPAGVTTPRVLCSAPGAAAGGSGGLWDLPAPQDPAAWLETPSHTSSHPWQQLRFLDRVQSQPTWDCEQLISPICATISF